MPVRYCWLIIMGSFLFLTIPAAGQEVKVVQDMRLWTGLKIEKSLGDNLTLFIVEEVRFRHNISEIASYFTEAGLRYRINKNFALEGQYRVTKDRQKDHSYRWLSRYSLDLRYKGRVKFLSVRYRLRYQKEIEDWNIFDQSLLYEKYLRHRLMIRYENLRMLKPYISGELFQLFEPGAIADLEYFRLILGTRFSLGEIGELNLGMGLNREITDIQPAMIYMIKVNYTYSF